MLMVNVSLPDVTATWFRIGDDRDRTEAMPSIEYLRRITSVGFFTKFPRFAPNPNTRRLTTPAILIAIARPIAT
jgi:hypothetical protein